MNTSDAISAAAEPLTLPAAFQSELALHVRSGEEIIAWFEPNLDAKLCFGSGIVVLTNVGVIARQPTPPEAESATWLRWDLSDVREIRKLDRVGLGVLELLGEKKLLQAWRFSAGNSSAAASLAAKFKLVQAGKTEEDEVSASICPSCGGAMLVGQMVCINCAPAPAPDTNRSLCA